MGGVTAIQGVDDTLKKIAKDATASLTQAPKLTVGPLKSSGGDLRLNWFLYRINQHPSYRNMESPVTGTRTARGRPPLALQLHYLLTAFPGGGAEDGDAEQFSHVAMAAAMRALYENAIVGTTDPVLSAHAKPLLEPLRITMEPLDLEALSKLWTTANEPMRLSVGYEVTLVGIDTTTKHTPGPPVRTRRVAVVPSLGPRLLALDPPRASQGDAIRVEAEGLTTNTSFVLVREAGDPSGPSDWQLTRSGNVVGLPSKDIAPGLRRVDAIATDDGLPAGRDSIGLTVVPAVTGPTGSRAPGTNVDLATAHAAPGVEVFLNGTALAANAVAYDSPTKVTITIPPATPAGRATLMLRAGGVAGPAFDGLTVGP